MAWAWNDQIWGSIGQRSRSQKTDLDAGCTHHSWARIAFLVWYLHQTLTSEPTEWFTVWLLNEPTEWFTVWLLNEPTVWFTVWLLNEPSVWFTVWLLNEQTVWFTVWLLNETTEWFTVWLLNEPTVWFTVWLLNEQTECFTVWLLNETTEWFTVTVEWADWMVYRVIVDVNVFLKTWLDVCLLLPFQQRAMSRVFHILILADTQQWGINVTWHYLTTVSDSQTLSCQSWCCQILYLKLS